LAAYKKAINSDVQKGFKTSREIALEIGKSHTCTKDMLRRLVREGRAEVRKYAAPNVLGACVQAPHYKLLPKPPLTKKKPVLK
jgi:hypothetical protein